MIILSKLSFFANFKMYKYLDEILLTPALKYCTQPICKWIKMSTIFPIKDILISNWVKMASKKVF